MLCYVSLFFFSPVFSLNYPICYQFSEPKHKRLMDDMGPNCFPLIEAKSRISSLNYEESFEIFEGYHVSLAVCISRNRQQAKD